MKQIILIISLCLFVTLTYGIVHNQLTTRISLEYFTIGHHKIIDSTSPTLLGIAWGIYSNWWVGLSLGILLAVVGRAGHWKKRDAYSFIKPLCFISLVSIIGAGIAGFLGYMLTDNGVLGLSAPLSTAVPASNHASYIAALWMHTASYFVATAASLILALFVFTRRISEHKKLQKEMSIT